MGLSEAGVAAWCCDEVVLFQGEPPWDDREFWVFLLTGLAFWATVACYFLFRDGGQEVSWKEFVNSYLSRGVVSASLESWCGTWTHRCRKTVPLLSFPLLGNTFV